MQEAATGSIDLSDHHTTCVDALVHYFYHLGYRAGGSAAVELHVQMCIIADKYDITALKDMAIHKFNVLVQDKNHNSHSNDFARAAEQAYEAAGPTQAIREAIVSVFARDHILSYETDKAETPFRNIMKESAELVTDYARELERQLRNKQIDAPATTDDQYLVRCPNNGCSALSFATIPEVMLGEDLRCKKCRSVYMGQYWTNTQSSVLGRFHINGLGLELETTIEPEHV